MRHAFLEIAGVSVGYGATQVLDDIDLVIGKGEFVALLGASGCGKTTLLRTIAGLTQPRAGRIAVGEREVTRLPPDKRGMALVFQSYALWPHMNVAQTIGYGLKLRRWPREKIAQRVAEMEKLLGLEGLSERKPAQLSGGQRQRVALGRALAIDPEILLLDEPLSNLDARIRLTVRHEIRALQQRLGITAIHVTHDREEAMVMADRIVILDQGRIVQQGTPEDIYNHPRSSFVAAFLGAENRLLVETPQGPMEARFRSEAAELGPLIGSPDLASGSFQGVVEAASYPGGLYRHSVRVGEILVLVDAPTAFAPGSAVTVRVKPEALFLFPADTTAAKAFQPGASGRPLEMSAH